MTCLPPPGFRWLRTGDEAFAAMLEAIDAAGVEVRLESYIITQDAPGTDFLLALQRACRRGVRVRVLVDAFGSILLPDSFWDPLRAAGGEVRWFNPLSLRRFSIRNHRKLLTCDGKVAFVGGFNLGPEWIGDGVERGWRDLGLVLEGPMLGELEASFDALYDLAEFRHRRFARWRRAVGRRTCCTHGAELLLNGPGRGHNVIGQSLRQDFERPLDITIIAAYFLPPRRLRRALARAVRRGGRVRLILAGQSDVPWMQLATRSLYRRLLKAGIEIHEYQPQVLHTKFIRVGEVVYVGSANLDNRSLHINYDFLLRLPDAALAASAGPLIDDHFAHARKIHFEEWAHGRPFWTRLKQRLALWVFSTLDPYIMRLQLQRLG